MLPNVPGIREIVSRMPLKALYVGEGSTPPPPPPPPERTPTPEIDYEEMLGLVTLTDEMDTAVIYYTTDGTDPGEGSTQYSAPFMLSVSCTVKAMAKAPECLKSQIATKECEFTLPNPSYYWDEEEGNFRMETYVEGAVVYYTDDGTEPTHESEVYTEPIHVTETTTFKFFAAKEGCTDSGTETYTVEIS